jgi:hypothetical protein
MKIYEMEFMHFPFIYFFIILLYYDANTSGASGRTIDVVVDILFFSIVLPTCLSLPFL